MIASTFFIVILLRDRVARRGPQAARRFFDSIRTNHADAMAADFRGDGVPTVRKLCVLEHRGIAR